MKKILSFVIPSLCVIAGFLFVSSTYTAKQTPSLEAWKKIYGDDIRSFIIESSPIDIPPFLHHPGIKDAYSVYIPENMWVIGFEPTVVGGPQSLLHHSNHMNMSAELDYCNGQDYPFFASGKESTSGFMPIPYAYSMNANDRVLNIVMFHNESPMEYTGVKHRLTIWYLPKDHANLKAVDPLFLDVHGSCTFSDFMVPPFSVSYHKKPDNPYVMKKSAKVILYGGHLHDYANSLSLMVNNRAVDVIQPKKDEKGKLISMPVTYPDNFFVHSGDNMWLETNTDNPLSREHDAMAQMLLFLYPF